MAAKYTDKVLATAQLMTLVQRARAIQGFTIVSELVDGRGGVNFHMSASINFASWGEKIDLHMFPYNEQQTMVEIKSECAMPTQLFDMGKNKENVEKILGYILGGIVIQRIDKEVPKNNYWGQNKK